MTRRAAGHSRTRRRPPLPVIDLHLHLEGSLPRSALAALARRHALPVPPLDGFGDLRGFLRRFGAVCDLLSDAVDFERAATALFARSVRRGAIHLEVLFSPQVFLRRGVCLRGMMTGLLRARGDAARRHGLSVVYIADGVRQWGPDWFERTIEAIRPWAARGIAGIGVGGDEGAIPARHFARAYRRARALGLRTTIHAGETGGATAVREAVACLGVTRIGHGIGAAGDPALLADLARRGVTLEVCPTSNVATGVAASIEDHPLPLLMAAGVRVTINSDDGGFFGTDARREMALAARAHGLTRAAQVQLLRNAARASFLTPRGAARLERRVLAASRLSGTA